MASMVFFDYSAGGASFASPLAEVCLVFGFSAARCQPIRLHLLTFQLLASSKLRDYPRLS